MRLFCLSLTLAALVAAGKPETADFSAINQGFNDLAIEAIARFPAFPFALSDRAGRIVSNEMLAGRALLLCFVASGDPVSRRMVPDLDRLGRLLARHRFSVVTVLEGEKEQLAAIPPRNASNMLLLADPSRELFRRYCVERLPVSYVIATDGTVIGAIHGPRDWAGEFATNFFALLAGPAVTPTNAGATNTTAQATNAAVDTKRQPNRTSRSGTRPAGNGDFIYFEF